VHEIAEKLRETRKFRDLSGETLEAIAEWAAARYAGREAVKAAKRKLHQVYGAYIEAVDIPRVEALAAGLPEHPDAETVKSVCREILAMHAGTAERLPYMEEIYPRLFAGLPEVRRVADVGCGLHPFARPWMGLPDETYYLAIDINCRLTETIDAFFPRAGYHGAGECRDPLRRPLEGRWDVVLLLKTLPCFEQQEKGASRKLLGVIDARRIVVSFPAKSLGGREKGMREHYRAFIEELMPISEVIETENETYYISDGNDG